MPWIVLFISSALEAVWATALGQSHGFTRPLPTAVFIVGLSLSMLSLAHAAKHIPISTAYAIWTGTGAALTVAYAMVTGDEAVSILRTVFLAGIVGAVAGLKLVKAPGRGGGSVDDGQGDRSADLGAQAAAQLVLAGGRGRAGRQG